MNCSIIGAGLIGRKRADAAKACGLKISYVFDINKELSQKLASDFNATAADSWKVAIDNDSTDIVFVATTHDSLAEIAEFAIKKGKHVLVEKPSGRSAREIESLVIAHQDANKKGFVAAKVGYNHRFHPMFMKLKELVSKGDLGNILYTVAEYGHGGRPNMENEWRSMKKTAGGGELVDQGSHLIDLYRWFFGDVADVSGFVSDYVWKSTDPVEDNAFFLLKNKKKNAGHFHVSWTMWKNYFRFNLTGTQRSAIISGIGKSYGPERLIIHDKDMGKIFFDETYSGEDKSFADETQYFIDCIHQKKQPEGNLHDALETMKVIEKIYAENKQ